MSECVSVGFLFVFVCICINNFSVFTNPYILPLQYNIYTTLIYPYRFDKRNWHTPPPYRRAKATPSMVLSKVWKLSRRPVGLPAIRDFTLVEEQVPPCQAGGKLHRKQARIA